jgi:hypothetical protein
MLSPANCARVHCRGAVCERRPLPRQGAAIFIDLHGADDAAAMTFTSVFSRRQSYCLLEWRQRPARQWGLSDGRIPDDQWVIHPRPKVIPSRDNPMRNLLIAALLVGVATMAHAQIYNPHEVCSGFLRSDKTGLTIGFEEGGQPVEGACLLPKSESRRIKQACKVDQPCTVIGVRSDPKPFPDGAHIVKIIAVFAGHLNE